MEPQQEEAFRIQEMRSILREKPKNAKVMSQLACLMADHATLTNNPTLRQEAVELSKRAIEMMPGKPFGYAALSTTSLDYNERMRALAAALELTSSSQSSSFSPNDHIFARIGFLARLLVEPRMEQSRLVQGMIGRGSREHPSRKDLTTAESQLYHQIVSTLEEAWSKEKLIVEQIEFLAKQEYRLGSFFRKMHPPEIQQERARTHFETCRTRQTSHQELATFWLATLQVDKGCEKIYTEMTRCPAKYVVGLYSTFAAKFDDLLLGQLDYETPTRLRQLLDTVVVEEKNKKNCKWHRAADLGCGTGLSGMAFSDIVNHLVGVDLSPAMLKQAKKRGIYDDLTLGELTCIFDKNDNNQSFDLVFACDVFVYLGDLSPVFESVSKSLCATSGLFCFSTEYMKEGDDGSSRPFKLHACARFAHKQSYIETLCIEFGFEILRLQICPIRLNQGKPVQGILVILRLK